MTTINGLYWPLLQSQRRPKEEKKSCRKMLLWLSVLMYSAVFHSGLSVTPVEIPAVEVKWTSSVVWIH